MKTQTAEYFMWSPHQEARHYKRYTGDVPIELKDAEIITIEDNRYVFNGNFKWVEITSKESADDQPIDGLVVQSSFITIRTNSLKVFTKGDLVELPKGCPCPGLYAIGDGIRADYAYTPKAVQTFQYLPLECTD